MQRRVIRFESNEMEGDFRVRSFLQERGIPRTKYIHACQHRLKKLLIPQSFNDHSHQTRSQYRPTLRSSHSAASSLPVFKVLVNDNACSGPLLQLFNRIAPCDIRARLRQQACSTSTAPFAPATCSELRLQDMVQCYSFDAFLMAQCSLHGTHRWQGASTTSHPPPVRILRLISSVIAPHAQRIKRLSCMIHGRTDIATFLKSGEGQFSVLEFLNISFVKTQARPSSSFPLTECLQFTTLGTLPRLRQATFDLPNGLHPLDLHLPWGQLSNLNLGTIEIPPHVFIKILHASTLHLEHGCFYVRFTKPMHPHLRLSKQAVTMHALRTLRLRLLFPSQDTRLFSLLRFPTLQTLTVEMHDEYQDWDISIYTKLLHASTKTLRELQFKDYPPHGTTDSGFVIKRRHCETTHRVFSKFFSIISNVESLYFPLGLHIDEATAEKMATYTLLPKLSMLESSSISGWPILSMARRRHELFLDALLVEHPEFEMGSSKQPIMNHHPPKIIYMLIPRGWKAEEKRALVEEAQALNLLGIRCIIQSTKTLPLPVINSKDVMRSRLLAWVEGVPHDASF